MLAALLLCAAFALSTATEAHVKTSAEEPLPLDEVRSTALDPVKEMVAAQQNTSLEGRPEDPLAVKEESLEEEESLAQEMARGRMLSYGVESRSSCPPGWFTRGSRCFIFINSPRSWAQAERYCLHLSANLVSIHSAEEHHFIQELVRRSTGGFPRTWIGATDIFENGLWFWTDGSRFDFQAWAYGEPNNTGGTEACAEMNSGAASLWNDFYCDRRLPFVCAMKLLSC